MSPAAYSLAIVCEAAADRETAAGLADRVLCAEVGWIEPEGLDSHRQWRGLEASEPHLLWREVRDRARHFGHTVHGVKAHGHFSGRPGAPDALAARKALLLLMSAAERPDAVVLVRDSDGDLQRRRGLEQAREGSDWPFEVLIGMAHPMREAWVLAGFEPASDAERSTLEELRRELGGDPCEHASSLTARAEEAPRSAKRVLARLTRGDRDRERSCWTEGDLAILQSRGAATGLADFLEEIRARLVPLFAGRRPGG